MKLVCTMQNQLMFINRMRSTVLSVKRIWTTIRKAVCKRFAHVEVVIREKVMQCMSKVMKKLCNEKLMI